MLLFSARKKMFLLSDDSVGLFLSHFKTLVGLNPKTNHHTGGKPFHTVKRFASLVGTKTLRSG